MIGQNIVTTSVFKSDVSYLTRVLAGCKVRTMFFLIHVCLGNNTVAVAEQVMDIPSLYNEILGENMSLNCCHVFRGDYRRNMDWWMDLLTTYTNHSELQVIAALSLISKIHKSPQHPLSLFPPCSAFISRSLATASNRENSSASRAQISPSQPPAQNSALKWQFFSSQPHSCN
jgi:hypothetical protein